MWILENMSYDWSYLLHLPPLTEPIRQRFGDSYAEDFRTAVELNARSLFSSREMTEEQRTRTKAFRETTLLHLKSSKKWYQKLWMQWILCLY